MMMNVFKVLFRVFQKKKNSIVAFYTITIINIFEFISKEIIMNIVTYIENTHFVFKDEFF